MLSKTQIIRKDLHMNILIYRYGSICEPDVITGFQTLGNHVSEITTEIYNKNLSPAEGVIILKNELLASNYDFVFSINFFPFISEVCNIFKICYICWTVDCPVMELYSNSIQNPWNRIFMFDRAQYEEFYAQNPSCIFYLPLASNPARWESVIANASAKDIAKYSSDVSFVGSLYTEKSAYSRLCNASDYLTGYLDGIMAAQQDIYGSYFLEDVLPDSIVSEFREHFPNFYTAPEPSFCTDRITLAQLYLGTEISARERVATMKSLGSHYPIDLYTGSDTRGLPVHNKGLAKTLTEMPLIFHFSKINLNITSKSIRTGLPLRIFDILGCGGFCLTNYQSELADYFTIGQDLECYTDANDLSEKITYYLSHEEERAEIARNGFETVQKNHNYPERLLQMLTLAYNIKEDK